MNNTLKQLYSRFCAPLPVAEAEQEIESCHKQFIERLGRPERKQALRIMDKIMDNQSLITEERSVDSFLGGFKPAWELAHELHCFKTGRHPFPAEDAERCLIFMRSGGTCSSLFISELLHFEQQRFLDYYRNNRLSENRERQP